MRVSRREAHRQRQEKNSGVCVCVGDVVMVVDSAVYVSRVRARGRGVVCYRRTVVGLMLLSHVQG